MLRARKFSFRHGEPLPVGTRKTTVNPLISFIGFISLDLNKSYLDPKKMIFGAPFHRFGLHRRISVTNDLKSLLKRALLDELRAHWLQAAISGIPFKMEQI
jgi:hypothetical protein